MHCWVGEEIFVEIEGDLVYESIAPETDEDIESLLNVDEAVHIGVSFLHDSIDLSYDLSLEVLFWSGDQRAGWVHKVSND